MASELEVDVHTLLPRIFPAGHELAVEDAFFSGSGRVRDSEVAIIGVHQAPIGIELAHRIAAELLRIVRDAPGRAILLLINTSGQRLSRRDELLGINGFMAHLAKCMELARIRGHRTLGLVYQEAVSAGFLVTGLLADACYALAGAEIKVMNLPAMSRITKIPLARLQALSQHSAVFAPGVDNYVAMGAIRAVWEGDLASHVAAALDQVATEPDGEQPERRAFARSIADRVRYGR